MALLDYCFDTFLLSLAIRSKALNNVPYMHVNLNVLRINVDVHILPTTHPTTSNIKQSKEHLTKGTNLYQIPLIPLAILNPMNNLISFGIRRNGETFSNPRLHTFNSVNLREQDSIPTSTTQPPPETPEIAKAEN